MLRCGRDATLAGQVLQKPPGLRFEKNPRQSNWWFSSGYGQIYFFWGGSDESWEFLPTEVMTSQGRAGISPSQFLEAQGWAYLLLDKCKADRISHLPAGAKFDTVEAEIKSLASSSMSGKRLFSSAWKSLVEGAIMKTISEAVDMLYKHTGPVIEAVLVNVKRSALEKIGSIPELEVVAAKRTVTIAFSGIELQLLSRSHGGHLDLSMQAAVRELGVACGLLEPLVFEEDLPASEKLSTAPVVDQKVLVHAQQSRRFFQQQLDSESTINGEVVMVSYMLGGWGGGGCIGLLLHTLTQKKNKTKFHP